MFLNSQPIAAKEYCTNSEILQLNKSAVLF
jgi:hypothetical protein